jgi:Ca2+-binding RTX toxin-like protein
MLINWRVLAPILDGLLVPTYGNYGGPQYSDGQLIEPGEVPTFAAPHLDALDERFREHDLVYHSSSDPNDLAQADLLLLRGIAALPDAALSGEGHLYAGVTTLALLASIAVIHGRPDLLTEAEVTLLIADAVDNLQKASIQADPSEVPALVAWFEQATNLQADSSQFPALGVLFEQVTDFLSQIPGLNALQEFLSLTSFFSPVGTAGDDIRLGGPGDDIIFGLGGADFIFGAAGGDHLYGGTGDDTVGGGAGNDRLFGGEGDDHLLGGAGDDRVDGGAGFDRLLGDDGHDLLLGRSRNDALSGGAGDDTLVGGSGREFLKGGSGDDDFVFHARSDTGVFSRDVIVGFDHGDTIDVSTLDADITLPGNQSFDFVSDFTGSAGQLQWDQTSSGFLVSGDVDGDGAADFTISVRTEVAKLFSEDFDL